MPIYNILVSTSNHTSHLYPQTTFTLFAVLATGSLAAPQGWRLPDEELTTYAANNGQTKLITYANGATVPELPARHRALFAANLDALALGLLWAQDPAAAQQAIDASEAAPLPYFGQTRTIGYASGEGYFDNPIFPEFRASLAPKLVPGRY